MAETTSIVNSRGVAVATARGPAGTSAPPSSANEVRVAAARSLVTVGGRSHPDAMPGYWLVVLASFVECGGVDECGVVGAEGRDGDGVHGLVGVEVDGVLVGER